LPAQIAEIAYQNKAVIYDLLFKASSETMLTIAADPKHLGARIGILSVLHTWGSALIHHPHVHMIVPAGGFSPDGNSWIPCRTNFLLAVPVLSRLFRRLFLQRLANCGSSASLPSWPTRKPSAPIWRRCATANGASTASPHSADPRKSCAISPAT